MTSTPLTPSHGYGHPSASWQLGGLTISQGWQPRNIGPMRAAELLVPAGLPLTWRQGNLQQILRAPWDLLYLAAGDRQSQTSPFEGWRLALNDGRLGAMAVERSGHRLSPGRCRGRLQSSRALHLRDAGDQGVGAALLQLLQLCQALSPNSQHAVTTAGLDGVILQLVCQLLCGDLIATVQQQRPTARGSKAQIVDDLLRWITANLDRPIELEDLVRQSGYSQRSLRNIFHERFSCGPVQWMRQQRLQMARSQLLAAGPDTTVSSVAAHCGYEHLSQFSRDFRGAFGIRPSELLREGRRQRAD